MTTRSPLRRTVGVAAAVLVVAIVGVGCLPPPPPPPKPTIPPDSAQPGFDACAAPSVNTMATWWASSPFSAVGIYIGGANRGCAQPNLTPSWVTNMRNQGWNFISTWVGPQAPCTTLGSTTKIPQDVPSAHVTGVNEANAAANAADALGFRWLDAIYYDMEAYPRGGACSVAVQHFASGWAQALRSRGYQAGFYSSLCSGILDLAAVVNDPNLAVQDSIWIAAWNDTPNIYNFGSPCALSNALWSGHRRIHQFQGGHNETWGGVTINIDTNAVDGPTIGR